ncbi:hypothetical protein [Streptococcus sp. 27098_8_76]|jgi:hypothetical protein|uniref:hypothetical protein n=1 Tax=Streptococcus sp. 27098_8_76 TaxID=3003658 RepID=UPI0021B67CFA
MLWIAEISQIPESVLKDAYNYIVKAEDELFHKKGIKKGLFGADKYWETMEQNLNTQKYVKSLNQQIIGKKLFQIVKN